MKLCSGMPLRGTVSEAKTLKLHGGALIVPLWRGTFALKPCGKTINIRAIFLVNHYIGLLILSRALYVRTSGGWGM